MSSTNSSIAFENVAAFKTALAKELQKVAQEQSLVHTNAASLMQNLGLPRPVVAASPAEVFEIPEIKEPETVDGKPRSAYSADWLAEHDRKALWQVRSNAYTNLRYEIGGYVKEADAIRVCEALGLPVPETKTTIHVKVKGVPSTCQFTVDGEVSDERREEIRAAFDSQVVDPMGDVARELYPDATGMPERVTVSMFPARVWPDFPKFEEPETSTTA